MSEQINVFLWGLAFAAFLVASLFFFRFYQRTRDRLFLAFGLAFILFALERAALLVIFQLRGHEEQFYLIRLFGFAFLIVAMIDKNRRE